MCGIGKQARPPLRACPSPLPLGGIGIMWAVYGSTDILRMTQTIGTTSKVSRQGVRYWIRSSVAKG